MRLQAISIDNPSATNVFYIRDRLEQTGPLYEIRSSKADKDKMTTKERVLKFTIMQRRNANLTEEEFRTYWTTKHAPVASAWFARNNILGYRQVNLFPCLCIPKPPFLTEHSTTHQNLLATSLRMEQRALDGKYRRMMDMLRYW